MAESGEAELTALDEADQAASAADRNVSMVPAAAALVDDQPGATLSVTAVTESPSAPSCTPDETPSDSAATLAVTESPAAPSGTSDEAPSDPAATAVRSRPQREILRPAELPAATPPLPKKPSRREILCKRLQNAYRCHLGRRVLRRYRKLQMFRAETRAAVTMQCFFRVRLAWEAARRKRALAHYKRFMLTSKPNLADRRWSEEEVQQLAAILMQSAWRRRQAYLARKRAENKRPFLTRMKLKLGHDLHYHIDDEALLEMAATTIQTKYRQRQAYFEAKRRAEAEALGRLNAAATKMQAMWRGGHERRVVKEERKADKLRHLAHFLTNAAFIKCFIIWVQFAEESRHNKRVLGKVVSRMLNMHVYRCLLIMHVDISMHLSI